MDKYFTWIFSRVIVCLHVAPRKQGLMVESHVHNSQISFPQLC